jgi:hypothetical protein
MWPDWLDKGLNKLGAEISRALLPNSTNPISTSTQGSSTNTNSTTSSVANTTSTQSAQNNNGTSTQASNGGILNDGSATANAVVSSMSTMTQGSAELTQADALSKINNANKVLAPEKATFKTFGKIASAAKFVGRVTGFVSVADHASKAYSSFSSGNIKNGFLNVGKMGVDVGLMVVKDNPVVATISVAYAIADSSGELEIKK